MGQVLDHMARRDHRQVVPERPVHLASALGAGVLSRCQRYFGGLSFEEHRAGEQHQD